MICFHGTSAQHDAAIQEDGLRAHWRSGGDRVDNQPGPYLAAHPLRAVCYALKAVAVEEIREGTRSRCAVYTLRVDRNALWADSLGLGRVREFCVRDGGVPADGIRAVWLFDPAAMVEQLRAAGAGMPQWSDLGWYGGLGAWRVLEETMALERCAHELGALADRGRVDACGQVEAVLDALEQARRGTAFRSLIAQGFSSRAAFRSSGVD